MPRLLVRGVQTRVLRGRLYIFLDEDRVGPGTRNKVLSGCPPVSFHACSTWVARKEKMAFRIIARLLALFMFWSGFAAIEAPDALGQSSTERSLLISQSIVPPAANEGSVEHHHLDDLPGQAQYEPPVEPSGLLPGMPKARAPSLSMARPLASVTLPTESPCLAGPLRPPCRAVHTA